jgi:3-isopropylmalate dehydrogenase
MILLLLVIVMTIITAFVLFSKDIANPIATISSASMMLKYSLDEIEASNTIDNAIKTAMKRGYRTKDLAQFDAKEVVNTQKMGDIIASLI